MQYTLKRLNSYNRSQVLLHFLRLDSESRYDRFCTPATDEFIFNYVKNINFSNGIFAVQINDINIIGVGECVLYPNKADEAEVAFSVEKPFQNRGIGNELMKVVIDFANANDVKKLYMHCLKHNVKTQHLAQKHGVKISFEKAENVGILESDCKNNSHLKEKINELECGTHLNIRDF